MTDYNEVSLEATIFIDGEEYRIIFAKKKSLSADDIATFIKLKNDNDAEQLRTLFAKLQTKKMILPESVTLPALRIPLTPVITKTGFFIQNELVQNDLKKLLIKSKLSVDELTDLGL